MTREAVARVAAAENSCSSRAQADKDIDYLGLLLCISGYIEDHHYLAEVGEPASLDSLLPVAVSIAVRYLYCV